MKLSQAKLLAKAPKVLEKGFKDKIFREAGNSATCWISTKGKIELNLNTSCYAGLLYTRPDFMGAKLLAVASMLFYGKAESWSKSGYELSLEEKTAYMDYIINRSPWANAFLSKDVASVMKRRTVFMDVDQASNYMIGAMIATRYTHEYTNWVKMWNDLVKVGVNPDLAWIIMHCTNYNPDKGDSLNIIFMGNGHSALCASTNVTQASNFLNHKTVTLNKPYRTVPSYYGMDKVWCNENEVDTGTKVVSILTDILRNVGTEKKSTNPFEAAKPEKRLTTTVKYEDFLKIIADNQEKIMEKIHA